MKFSIVTASYNSAATIGETLNSVRSQTYTNYEHIIADGQSSDRTAEIVRREAPWANLAVERDRGIYDGMNKGIASASGDVVALLNSDDYYADPHVLERVASLFMDNDIDVVFSNVAFFRDGAPEKITRQYNSRIFTPERLAYGIMPAHPGMFLKRRVYQDLGLFKTDYKIASDFEFVARMFTSMSPKYRFMDEITVMMRVGGASTNGIRSNVTILQESLRACKENDISSNYMKMLVKYLIKLTN